MNKNTLIGTLGAIVFFATPVFAHAYISIGSIQYPIIQYPQIQNSNTAYSGWGYGSNCGWYTCASNTSSGYGASMYPQYSYPMQYAYPSYSYGGNYGYVGAYGYPTGRTDFFGIQICDFPSIGYYGYECGSDPSQPVQDVYTGEWY